MPRATSRPPERDFCLPAAHLFTGTPSAVVDCELVDLPLCHLLREMRDLTLSIFGTDHRCLPTSPNDARQRCQVDVIKILSRTSSVQNFDIISCSEVFSRV